MVTASRAAERPTVPSLSQSAPLLLLATLMLIAVTATGLFQVLQTSRTATIGYELRDMERARATLAAEVRLLEAEIAQMSRLDEIRRQAVERLGMAPPEQTLRIAVAVPAPRVIPMPERYVVAAETTPRPSAVWWERLARRLPGFD